MNATEDRDAHRNRIIVLGGYLNRSLPATFGETAILEIHRYRADIALLSPVGVDARSGATSFDPGEAEVARAMVTNAQHVIILADYSKIGLASRVSYCPSTRFDRLITNGKAADRPAMAELRQKSVPISLAG
jgi:DeoR/GlpR family transcriptional regulator of sugar metabolism